MNEPVKLLSLLRPGHAALDCLERLLAEGIPGLRRMIYNDVLPIDVRTGSEASPPFAGVVESWFASRAEADNFARQVRAAGEAVQLTVDPLLIHDSGRRPLPNKIMATLKRRADLSREQAQKHWRTRHIKVGLVEHNATDFLQLYYQNHVLETDQPPGSAFDFDGMPEFWVDPADLTSIGEASPVMRAIAEDEALFADRASIITLMLEERELFVAADAEGGWPVRESPLHEVLVGR